MISKIFICRRAGAHESCWMNFLTKVGNWEVSTTSRRKSASRVPLTDSQAVTDRVRRELMRTLKQWMTLYWVRRTSPKRTDRPAKFYVKLAFTVPVSVGSFTVIFNSIASSPLWCRLPCQNGCDWAELKLMANTTAMSCCLCRWFQPSNR